MSKIKNTMQYKYIHNRFILYIIFGLLLSIFLSVYTGYIYSQRFIKNAITIEAKEQSRITTIILKKELQGKFSALDSLANQDIVINSIMGNYINEIGFINFLDNYTLGDNNISLSIFDFSGNVLYTNSPKEILKNSSEILTMIEQNKKNYIEFLDEYMILSIPIQYLGSTEGLLQATFKLEINELHFSLLENNIVKLYTNNSEIWSTNLFTDDVFNKSLYYSEKTQLQNYALNIQYFHHIAQSQKLAKIFVEKLSIVLSFSIVLAFTLIYIFGAKIIVEPFKELAQSKKELEQNNKELNLFKSIIHNANDAIIVTSIEDKECLDDIKIIYTNPSFTKISGYSAKEALGKNPKFLQGINTNQKIKSSLQKESNYSGKILNYNKNNIPYWIDINIFPIYATDNSKITNFAAVERDITERINRENELTQVNKKLLKLNVDFKQAKEQAEKFSKSKSMFLANMSHEIRTPMHGIIGMLNILKTTKFDDQQLTYIESIERSSNNLLNLINDILDFSKIESGKMTLENTEFSLKLLCNNLCHLYSNLAKEKNLNFECIYTLDDNLLVIGDQTKLEQILNNFLSNAIKFTASGKVTLQVLEESQDSNNLIKIKFNVSDTGIGMTKKNITKIFDKFIQADESTTRKFGGTGLGLSICKELAKLMEGNIDVTSIPNKGSIFSIIIPFVQVTRTSKIINKSIESSSKMLYKKDLNILIVEDYEINAQIIISMLKFLKIHNYHLAKNGQEALEMFAKNNYDLIFMDIQMPIMSGYEASEEIRRIEAVNSNKKSVVIIALTANAMKKDETKCIDSGMNDFISKPFVIEDITKKLSHWFPG